MKFLKNRLVLVGLSLTILGAVTFGAVHMLKSNNIQTYSKPNSVYVQKIDNNHAKLSCDSIKTANSDFLLSKSCTGESYQYDLTDLTGNQKYYGFSSKTNIDFSEGVSNNSQLCGTIAGAIAAPTVAGGVVAVGAAGTAAVGLAPVVGAIGGAGAASAAAGLGVGIGLKVGGALVVAAVAAAPVAVVAGIAFSGLMIA